MLPHIYYDNDDDDDDNHDDDDDNHDDDVLLFQLHPPACSSRLSSLAHKSTDSSSADMKDGRASETTLNLSTSKTSVQLHQELEELMSSLDEASANITAEVSVLINFVKILRRSGFTDLGSIPGQGKLMSISVFYH